MERVVDEVVLSRAEVADSTVLPDRYARPDEVGDGVVVGDDENYEVPLVDMARLLDPDSSEAETAKLGSACRDWGFFQLTNHGVEESVAQDMKDSTTQFFRLPLDKKKAVATKAGGVEGFGHHFLGASRGKLDWAESLVLKTQLMEERSMEFWPADPAAFRSSLDKYSLEMSKLTSRLLAFMASDLGVEPEALAGAFRGKKQTVALHHYPPCQHPDKVLGITPHHDGLGLTLLLHVDDTPGLQVRRDGRWFPLDSLPGALVINVGDMLQILTNGRYKSPEHRVLADAERGRATAVVFQEACVGGMVRPLPGLGDARYRAIEYAEYFEGNYTALAEGTRFVDSLQISVTHDEKEV
ncbi:hypothetical protein CFC21_003399 [Triticum aestivum]|uniref:Fe2OG dioxygenase domain-containing protein n=1 Tax=Triticum aestivum TaxID=4565 RepID=A0A3B5Y4I5_WHEAT|nr:2-oxoglutarate-dependent dioxygenase 11-like isoform X1 [Triticum aestivum]KAF6985547.1 hypothetical protein CFC21_003393 [Triticum aestivum]KAF6985556.1 hypothetical protein CFC21_003399 [Triticum aestivum]